MPILTRITGMDIPIDLKRKTCAAQGPRREFPVAVSLHLGWVEMRIAPGFARVRDRHLSSEDGSGGDGTEEANLPAKLSEGRWNGGRRASAVFGGGGAP